MVFSRGVEHFLAVAEHVSFHKAAVSLRITQAALSLSIKQLEQDLGVKLFTRSHSGSELTEQGRKIFQVLKIDGGKLRRDLEKEIVNEADQPVRIGCSSHLATRAFDKLLKTEEGKRIQGFFGYSKLVLEALNSGELDFGFITWTHSPKIRGDLNLINLGREPDWVVGRKGKFDEIKRIKSPQELNSFPWIWHRKPQHSWTHYLKGLKSTLVVDGSQVATKMVLEGWGIANFQLLMFSPEEVKKLVFAKFTLPFDTNVFLIHRMDLSPRVLECMQGARALVEDTVEFYRSLEKQGRK